MIHIVQELRKCKGTNAKLQVLKNHESNTEWKKVLVAMYDSSLNYYVSAPRDLTFLCEELDYTGMFKGLSLLSNREFTGNLARDHAIEMSQDYGEILRLILGGSLKAGVSITSINKVYPGLIPTFDVMLAQDAEITEYPIWASTKYDGVRVVVFVNGGEVDVRTRAGKQLNIKSLIHNMKNQEDGVYDGELVAGEGLQIGRTSITGSVNRVLKGSKDDIKDYQYCIFDRLTLEEWVNKECQRSYLTRSRELNDSFIAGYYINHIQQTEMLNPKDIDLLYRDRIAYGYEGLILRYPEDMYNWKRSSSLIKKKATDSCILLCTGVQEGTGKYAGMIGSLICEGTVDGKDIRVKLGTGLSDYDRDMSPESYIGRRVDAMYNDVVRAKDSKYYSLFLPRFKRLLGDMNV